MATNGVESTLSDSGVAVGKSLSLSCATLFMGNHMAITSGSEIKVAKTLLFNACIVLSYRFAKICALKPDETNDPFSRWV
jgi:hypothetical protein